MSVFKNLLSMFKSAAQEFMQVGKEPEPTPKVKPEQVWHVQHMAGRKDVRSGKAPREFIIGNQTVRSSKIASFQRSLMDMGYSHRKAKKLVRAYNKAAQV